jgi:hypothetical protein
MRRPTPRAALVQPGERNNPGYGWFTEGFDTGDLGAKVQTGRENQ